jgi:hypothetical protein
MATTSILTFILANLLLRRLRVLVVAREDDAPARSQVALYRWKRCEPLAESFE